MEPPSDTFEESTFERTLKMDLLEKIWEGTTNTINGSLALQIRDKSSDIPNTPNKLVSLNPE